LITYFLTLSLEKEIIVSRKAWKIVEIFYPKICTSPMNLLTTLPNLFSCFRGFVDGTGMKGSFVACFFASGLVELEL